MTLTDQMTLNDLDSNLPPIKLGGEVWLDPMDDAAHGPSLSATLTAAAREAKATVMTFKTGYDQAIRDRLQASYEGAKGQIRFASMPGPVELRIRGYGRSAVLRRDWRNTPEMEFQVVSRS